jgi:hypothetical protein
LKKKHIKSTNFMINKCINCPKKRRLPIYYPCFLLSQSFSITVIRYKKIIIEQNHLNLLLNKLYMVFWGKNLDLGSHLFNLRKLINNENKPKETLLLNPTAELGSNSPTKNIKQPIFSRNRFTRGRFTRKAKKK